MSGILKLDDFAGDWLIERTIEDHLNGPKSLTGKAEFRTTSEGLAYVEKGILNIPGQKPLQTRQEYVWVRDGSAIEVRFSDGRPFHRITLSNDHVLSDHFCDPDQYDVTYDFSCFPEWKATWKVKGPRKDYTMITSYRRP